MPTIHPTAIVDRQAQLADDVQIGPHCVIQGPAVLGPGCRLIGNVYLQGRVVLGRANVLYPFVCVGFEPQDRKFTGQTAGVVIGDRNVMREYVSVHCATHADHPTTIGHDNYLMTSVHVAHDDTIGNRCTIASGVSLAGHVQLADDVNIGGNSVVHQFCRFGRMSFMGGQSAATSDLPPFALATGFNNLVGVNLVGLRRAGLPRPAIDAVKAAFDTLYLSGHTNPVAVALLEEAAAKASAGAEMVRELAQFVRQSKRGLMPHAAVSQKQGMRR